jgi:hypothetical protein
MESIMLTFFCVNGVENEDGSGLHAHLLPALC